MQVRGADVVEVDRPHDPDAELGCPLPNGVEIVDLHEHHVPDGRRPTPLEVAAGGGAVLDGRDDLEEGVADRVDGVVEAELADTRISERRPQPLRLELALRGVEVPGRERDLAEPHPPSGSNDGGRFST